MYVRAPIQQVSADEARAGINLRGLEIGTTWPVSRRVRYELQSPGCEDWEKYISEPTESIRTDWMERIAKR